jgi:hypothetical protein
MLVLYDFGDSQPIEAASAPACRWNGTTAPMKMVRTRDLSEGKTGWALRLRALPESALSF